MFGRGRIKPNLIWPIPFGQSQLAAFGHPYLAEFGQFLLTGFGQTAFCQLFFVGGTTKSWRPEGWPKDGVPKVGEVENFAFFFPSPAPSLLFLSFSGWSSRGILVVFLKRRSAEMCTFGVLGLSCEAPEAPKRTFECPSLQNTTKIQREPSQEREERMKFPAGERKKKERNFGWSRGRAVRRRGVRGRGPKILNTPTTHTPTGTTNRHHQQAPPTGTNRQQPGTTTT